MLRIASSVSSSSSSSASMAVNASCAARERRSSSAKAGRASIRDAISALFVGLGSIDEFVMR
jgi:hypothetical protein